VLAHKDILLIGAWDDIQVPFDGIVFPFYKALKSEKAAHLRLVGFQDDHYFNKTRKELAETIINWLQSLPGKTRLNKNPKTNIIMSPQIFILKLGINRCYLIKGKHTIMIDGGPPNQLDNFLKQLSVLEIEPKEIRLIVLTHGDIDHIGLAKSIKEVTGANVAIHENDRKLLEEGRFNWPPGVTPWGLSVHFALKPFIKTKKFLRFNPTLFLLRSIFRLMIMVLMVK
jgi:hypothetical protein